MLIFPYCRTSQSENLSVNKFPVHADLQYKKKSRRNYLKSIFNSFNCQMWGTRKASPLQNVRYISIKRIVKVDLPKRISRSKVTELGPSSPSQKTPIEFGRLENIMSNEITTIVEKELLPNVNVLVGVDADPVVAGHHQDLHLAVGFAAVVREPDLSPHPEQYRLLPNYAELTANIFDDGTCKYVRLINNATFR